MTTLRLARDLELPLTAVTQRIAFLGLTGSGKTYGAGKFVELLYDAGAQVIVVDHVGTWGPGLRLSSTGRTKGIPIPVFGGETADVPLEHTAGAMIADLAVDRGISMVLDVSHLRKGRRTTFITDFAEQFFHRKKKKKGPVHLVLEEAQAYLPQKAYKGSERMLGAMEDLCKVGRNYGIGISLISQRPQAIQKDALNLTELLLVFQMNGPQERKTIQGWVVAHDVGEDTFEAFDELPTLETGEALAWSPRWLRFFGKIKILKKRTYDASATPELGVETATTVPDLSPKELASLRVAMQESVDRAAAENPGALRKQIAALEKELANERLIRSRTPKTFTVAIPALTADERKELRSRVTSLKDGARDCRVAAKATQGVIDNLEARLRIAERGGDAVEPGIQPRGGRRPRRENVDEGGPARRAGNPDRRVAREGGPPLLKGERKMLEVLARYHPMGLTWGQVGSLAGYRPRGGTFRNYRAKLRRLALVVDLDSGVQLTNAGFDAIGADVPSAPMTPDELRATWNGALLAGERKMLDVLIAAYPDGLTPTDLGAEAGYTHTGGTFRNYRAKLVRNGLVEVRNGSILAAADIFFLQRSS